MNQGVHTVDLLLWFLGRPVEVFAHTALLAHERVEVEDVAVATIRFASGALAVLHATTAAFPGLAVRLQVHGDGGSAVIHDDQLEYFSADGDARGPARAAVAAAGRAARRRPRTRRLRGRAPAAVRGHRRRHRRSRPARRPGRGRASSPSRVVRAMYLSATLGRPVRFDEVLAGELDDDRRGDRTITSERRMKFSVFTASTPEWTPEEAARILAAQGWDGIEWRVTDQAPADVPGFWAGNRATWPLTGLEDRLARDRADHPREPAWSISGLGGYARCDDHDDVERMLAATARARRRPGAGHHAAAGLRRLPRPVRGRPRATWSGRPERAAHHGVKAPGRAAPRDHHAVRLGGVPPASTASTRSTSASSTTSATWSSRAGRRRSPRPAAARPVPGARAREERRLAARGARGGRDGPLAARVGAAARRGQATSTLLPRARTRFGYDGWVTCEDFSTELPLDERTRDNLAYLRTVEARTRERVAA